MTRNLELLTVFVIQLVIIVDPLAGIPIFLNHAEQDEDRACSSLFVEQQLAAISGVRPNETLNIG